MKNTIAALAMILLSCLSVQAQTAAPLNLEPTIVLGHAELRFVVYLTRHGVRSPTGKAEQYNAYSAAPWPAWDVAPGYLTAHGFKLMQQFGAYDRIELAGEGLLAADGCKDAQSVTVYADSDQRTRETGRALASGLFPGCTIPVLGHAEGVQDALFHSRGGANPGDAALAVAAIAGRSGGDVNNLTEAYRPQLAALDEILSTCGASGSIKKSRTSLFDIPAVLAAGTGDHRFVLRGPLNTASTLTENLLLEYTEGMDAANVGWGCVNGAKLRSLLSLHTAAEDFAGRTPVIARAQVSQLLNAIRASLEQAATGKQVPEALSKPSDRVLFVVGHDTNLANLAGLLNLNWIADGSRDDTPPGGALVFELWRARSTGQYFVRTFFTAQTLEQMRSAAPLSLENPPQRVPVFLPGCSNQDFSCSWPAFLQTIHQAIDPPSLPAK